MLQSPRSMAPDDFCPRSRFLSTYWGRGTDMPVLEAVDLLVVSIMPAGARRGMFYEP
jgi:hypothetical protein